MKQRRMRRRARRGLIIVNPREELSIIQLFQGLRLEILEINAQLWTGFLRHRASTEGRRRQRQRLGDHHSLLIRGIRQHQETRRWFEDPSQLQVLMWPHALMWYRICQEVTDQQWWYREISPGGTWWELTVLLQWQVTLVQSKRVAAVVLVQCELMIQPMVR